MTKLSMKQIRYFDALARHGHFGRAAEECTISQPALSVQIKELEETIGAPLVERGSRQIHLTGLGVEFGRRARGILHSVNELEDLARASQGSLGGQLRLGIISTMAPYLLSRIAQHLIAHYPGLDLRPQEAKTKRLIAELLDARLDAAIVALPISEPALSEIQLFSEEFVLVRPQTDAEKPVPNPSVLKEMRLLLLEEGHCFRDQAISFCDISLSQPRSVMEGSSLTTLVQMVAVGIGITLLPEMAVPFETRSAAVSVARLPDPKPTRTIGMVWRKSNPMADQLMEMAQIIKKASMPTQSDDLAG